MSTYAMVDGVMREITRWPVMVDGAVRELNAVYSEVDGAVRIIYQKTYQWEKWTRKQIGGSYELIQELSNKYLFRVEYDNEIYLYSSYSVNGQGRLDLLDGDDVILSEGNIFRNYKYHKPSAQKLNECITAKKGSGGYKWEIYGNQYDLQWISRYAKGDSLVEIVESTNKVAYPEDGYQDGYWYVKT